MGPALHQEATALKALLRRALGWEYEMTVLPGASGLQGLEEDGDDEGPVLVENPQDLIAL